MKKNNFFYSIIVISILFFIPVKADQKFDLGKDLFLNEKILPLIKIDSGDEHFYNYEAKYFSNETKYICPSGLDPQVEERIQKRCFNACKLFAIRGWGRIDFFIDQNYEPVILEINTVPGMTTHSLVPMAASEVGIDFDQLCFNILEISIV